MDEDKKQDPDAGKPVERSHKIVTRAPGPGNRKYWRQRGLVSKKEGTSVDLASGHNSGTKQAPRVTKVIDPYARLPRSQRAKALQTDAAKREETNESVS